MRLDNQSRAEQSRCGISADTHGRTRVESKGQVRS